jgi:hypothetical protein
LGSGGLFVTSSGVARRALAPSAHGPSPRTGCLTLRSSADPSPASRLAARLSLSIIRLAASRLPGGGPLSSNVRAHQVPTAIFSVLAVVACFAFVVWVSLARSRALSRQRASIDEAFRSHNVASADPVLNSNPDTAVLLREQEECREGDAIQSHRIYRNESGEYFLFVCKSGEKGYLTHLTRQRAMNALRSDRSLFRREFPDAVASVQRSEDAP